MIAATPLRLIPIVSSTVNLFEGLVVPIPTLPEPFILTTSAAATLNLNELSPPSCNILAISISVCSPNIIPLLFPFGFNICMKLLVLLSITKLLFVVTESTPESPT